MTARRRKIIALILNLVMVFLEAFALLRVFINRDGSLNYTLFLYYTHDANILAFIASLWCSLELSKELSGASARTLHFARYLQYLSVCGLTVTIIVVFTVIIPFGSKGASYLLLSDSFFLEHILCPVLSVVSFVFFGDCWDFDRKLAFHAMIPTSLYAVVIGALNIAGAVYGPFSFFKVYEQSLFMSVFWFLVLNGGTYCCARILLYLASRFNFR